MNGIPISGCLPFWRATATANCRSCELWGTGDLNVAVTLGKIIRERGLDVSAGVTTVAGCAKTPDAACFALKRSGNPLDARIDNTFVTCDVVCVLIGRRRTSYAAGRRRSL